MRQVPISRACYLIIGGGRVATHLARYFDLLELAYKSWKRSENEPLTEKSVEGVSHILLAISDKAIEPFLEHHSFLLKKNIIHFSGALTFPNVLGAHPFTSFAKKLFSLEEYQEIPFVVDQDINAFKKAFPSLPNPVYALDPKLNAKYHAFCVVAGNFPQMLWKDISGRMEKELKLPKDLLKTYIQRITKNFLFEGEKALTGPFVRKDYKTIEKNCEALEGSVLRSIYEAFKEYL